MQNKLTTHRDLKTFIDQQTHVAAERRKKSGKKCFVTVTRQTGAAGPAFFRMLGAHLMKHDPDRSRWMVFDKNLIRSVLDEHHMPQRIADYMSEETHSDIEDTLEEIFGMHPARWTLVHKTTETILHLAQLGHSVIVGRGSNAITRKLPGGFHVRLVASLDNRVKRIQDYYHLNRREAVEFVRREDRGKKAYLSKYFGKDIDDMSLYDLVINTDRLCYEDAVSMIGAAVHNLSPVEEPIVGTVGE